MLWPENRFWSLVSFYCIVEHCIITVKKELFANCGFFLERNPRNKRGFTVLGLVYQVLEKHRFGHGTPTEKAPSHASVRTNGKAADVIIWLTSTAALLEYHLLSVGFLLPEQTSW